MKLSLTIFTLVLASLSYGQANNDTIQVIAKLISPGEGSKIHVAEYQVITDLSGGTIPNDTIHVGYYFEGEVVSDTCLLNLQVYSGESAIEDYYVFPEYNAKSGIETVQISTISYDYWKQCEEEQLVDGEIVESECSLTFTGKLGVDHWFLYLPCGGPETGITFTEQYGNTHLCPNPVGYSCPPVYELNSVPNGKYFAFMMAGDLFGVVEINVKRETEK